MKYNTLIKEIIEKVGGKENIVSVEHCMTRLRFTLKDKSIPDENEVKDIKSVLGVVNNSAQFQVIIGTHVDAVYKEMMEVLDINGKSRIQEEAKGKEGNLGSRIMKSIAGCVLPSLPALIGSGILKGILAALAGFGLMSTEGGTYQILYGAANALYYFFPIIIGFNAAKVFDITPSLGAVIGAALVYPDLIAAENLNFMGIPVVSAAYTYTVFPVIVAVFFASYVDKFCRKYIPEILKTVLVPTIILAVTIPVTYLAIGPVVNIASTGALALINWIFNAVPVVAGALLGGLWQLLVMFGLHQAIIPLIIQETIANGFSHIDACVGLSLFGVAGMALGYALGVKDKNIKAESFGHFFVAMCGITEPAIYAIGVPHIKLFACGCLGSGAGGFIMALFGGKTYGVGGAALFNAPLFIGPEGINGNLALWAACAAITVAVAAIAAFIITGKEVKESKNGF